MAKRIKNPMSSVETPGMGGNPKPTGPNIKKEKMILKQKRSPFKQRMHADKNWRNNPEHKQTQKVTSKLSKEAKVADVPQPNVSRGPGYDGRKGYSSK